MPLHAPTEPPHWADDLATILALEINADRPVRVALPNLSEPIEVASAHRWGQVLGIKDPQGARFYVYSPVGVVILGSPISAPDPNEKPYWMQVDEPGWQLRKAD